LTPAPIAPAKARKPFAPGDYRYPGEHVILVITLGVVGAVIALTAAATLGGSVLFVGLMLALAFAATRGKHNQLVEQATRVTPQNAPGLWSLVQLGSARLAPEAVEVYVTPSRVLNAYTFGLDTPKVLVIEGPLLRVLDSDELAFVISHELGHVRLGHTWLNSLVGGLAGIPSSVIGLGLMQLAFLWWNRACEYSADRAGLLATGKPDKAISALVKIATGGRAQSPADMALALKAVEAQGSDVASQIGEALATHPLMARRIAHLREYAASKEFQKLIARK
jgi:Zn-dependent protease with chaperone function